MYCKLTGIVLAVLLLMASCNPRKVPVANAEINPEFEFNPPIATEVFVQQLDKPDKDGNNLLLIAQFPDSAIRGQFHAVMAGDQKVVLRDDGQGGDEKAGDHLFTVALNENIAELQKVLNTGQESLQKAFDQKKLVRFEDRSAVMVDRFQSINATQFIPNERSRITELAKFFAVDERIKDHSLMINDLSVVEDPSRTFNPCTGVGTADGAWTFSKLMKDLIGSSGVDPVVFAREWLDNWMNDRTFNSDLVNKRDAIFNRIIKPWIQRSGTPGGVITTANWKTLPLNLQLAPFRLLAIVNRLDLAGNIGYGNSKGGEGRFVFCALDENCSPLKFTVIFEYGINIKDCKSIVNFAKEWYALRLMPFDANFNNALQLITDKFAGPGTNPSKPNGSSLNQLRTNEIALAGPWELREFVLSASTHLLELTSTKREPQKKFNRFTGATPGDLQKLADWVNANSNAIKNNTFDVPLTLSSGDAFLGAKAHITGAPPPPHFWDAATSGTARITDDKTRHLFSLNTCSGCHGREAKTPDFTHVMPAPFGSVAALSGFLTGKGPDDSSTDNGNEDFLFFVSDPAGRPAGSPQLRGFNDLQDRADKLETLVNRFCLNKAFELLLNLRNKPLMMTH